MQSLSNRIAAAVLVVALVSTFSTQGCAVGTKLLPTDGFVVLVVHEEDEQRNLPVPLLSVLQSDTWKQAVEAKGGAWRVLDRHATFTEQGSVWEEGVRAVLAEGGGLPAVLIQSDRGAKILPLPASVDAMQALVKQYGG